ncbi:MAG: alpha/beta hydrolase [Gammaproteobacteria bacterium]|nr:alpha/beta hydrolase [Gammaproteobacteria bacterium]
MIYIYLSSTVVLLIVAHVFRQGLVNREHEIKNHEYFNGVSYQVGAASVGHRKVNESPDKTVVCMPGFLEDQRYFTELYNDPEIELILLNSANYHLPITSAQPQLTGFSNEQGYAENTIEYDAAVLNWTLSNLASSSNVRVHGHSRGGAVALEAAKQEPALHQKNEFILESPVLPQAKAWPPLDKVLGGSVSQYLLPLFVPFIKRAPVSLYAPILYRPLSSRKKTLIAGLFYAPKTYQTIIDNVTDLERWMFTADYSLFENINNGVILIGQKDTVLDRASMLESAGYAGDKFRIIETQGTTHFITQDVPEYIPQVSCSSASPRSVA